MEVVTVDTVTPAGTFDGGRALADGDPVLAFIPEARRRHVDDADAEANGFYITVHPRSGEQIINQIPRVKSA